MDTESDTRRYAPAAAVDGRASRAAITYDAIKRQLLFGAFAVGDRLGEERLARELNVSRTPVREALSRLHAEGLVDRHPDGGYVPSIPDLGEIAELYEVRAALEQSALHRDGHAVGDDPAPLTTLRTEWRVLAEDAGARTPDPAFVLRDEDFHLRLAAASGNRALVAILSGVNERIRVVRMHDFLTEGRIEATIEQHLGILEAVLDGDGRRAGTALEAHLIESAHVVQDRAAQAIANMVRGTRSLR